MDRRALFAQVESNGTINASSPGITAGQAGTGIYLVNLGQDITRCAAIAEQGALPVFGSPGGSSGSVKGDALVQISAAGTVIEPGYPSADTVLVETFNGTLAANASFYLAVLCSRGIREPAGESPRYEPALGIAERRAP
jgi:hypothetical protein